MFYILSFIFGSAIGSFVQVVVSRLHVAPIIKGRSKCLSCGEALRVSDLIPIVSFLWLRGKCKYCKTPYGIESLIVEIIFGLSFLLLYLMIVEPLPNPVYKIAYGVYYTLLFIVLGVIALYDRRHSYIPSSFLFSFSVLSFLMLALRYLEVPQGESVSLVLAGPFLTALPFLTLFVLTKRKGVGFGDVILFFGVGAFFGIEQSIAVLMLSIWIGAFVGVLLYSASFFESKKEKSKDAFAVHAMPFVPFIVIAFLIVLFTDVDIFSIANSLSGWYY